MVRRLRVVWMAWALAGAAYAEPSELFWAMEKEMERSTRKLRLENLDIPYYLAYTAFDEDGITLMANFGALNHSSASRQRQIAVDLRVGGYRFDNRNFIGRRGSRTELAALPIEDDTVVIRRALWLATDRAFKQASEEISAKRAALEKQIDTGDPLYDFSTEAVETYEDPPISLDLIQTEWERRVRSASAMFRNYPNIESSEIQLRAGVATRYFLDSEKRKLVLRKFHFTVEIGASATTPDGQTIQQGMALEENDSVALPTEEALQKAVQQLAGRLNQFYDAQAASADYIGPVLLSPEAAATFLTYALAPHLSGGKPPVFENPRHAQRYAGGDFLNRLGQKVMPDFMTVMDDPYQTRFMDHAIMGSYRYDQEGIAGQKVVLVEKGILKNFLMSRTPMNGFDRSNGHGRGQPSRVPAARAGCLYVTGKATPFKELWEKFLDLCRDEGLEDGYFITTLGPPVQPVSRSSNEIVLSMGGSREKNMLSVYGAYRVDIASGDSIPIRGLEIMEPKSRDLRLILDAGADMTVDNYWDDKRSSGRIPASLVCPSFLLKEMEVVKSQPEKSKPPLLPHPTFGTR